MYATRCFEFANLEPELMLLDTCVRHKRKPQSRQVMVDLPEQGHVYVTQLCSEVQNCNLVVHTCNSTLGNCTLSTHTCNCIADSVWCQFVVTTSGSQLVAARKVRLLIVAGCCR